jgi:hypothetical protein
MKSQEIQVFVVRHTSLQDLLNNPIVYAYFQMRYLWYVEKFGWVRQIVVHDHIETWENASHTNIEIDDCDGEKSIYAIVVRKEDDEFIAGWRIISKKHLGFLYAQDFCDQQLEEDFEITRFVTGSLEKTWLHSGLRILLSKSYATCQCKSFAVFINDRAQRLCEVAFKTHGIFKSQSEPIFYPPNKEMARPFQVYSLERGEHVVSAYVKRN